MGMGMGEYSAGDDLKYGLDASSCFMATADAHRSRRCEDSPQAPGGLAGRG